MKKYISFFLAGSLLLGLCSCKFDASLGDEDINISVSENLPLAADTSPEETEAPVVSVTEASDTETAEAETAAALDEGFTPADQNPAGEYAKIMTCETKYGDILYPVLNTEKLNAAEAEAANALFEHIKDELAANTNETDVQFEPTDENLPISKTYISVYGNILSVLMSYEYTFGYPGTFYKSVIFDISTGNAISSDEAAKAVSLMTEDIKASILWFSKVYMLNVRDMNYIYELAGTGVLPEFTSHDGFANDEKVLLEDTLDDYDECNEYSGIENEGMPWERLPFQHTAYLNERGQLYVLGTVFFCGEIERMMVAVAHSEEEIAAVNNRGEFNPIVRKRYFEPVYAGQAIADIVDPAIMPTFDTESVIMVYDDYWDRYFPAYSVNVFSNTGYAPALVEKYAVGVFESFIWKMDDNGEWEKLNAPFGFNEDEARDRGALAVVWRPEGYPQPFNYSLWAAKPVYEVTLDSTGRITPADKIMDNCCITLVYALYDGTNVAFLEGAPSGDGFNGELYKSFTLNSGEFAAVYFVAGDVPTEAIETSTGFAKGTFPLTNDIYGADVQPILIYPDTE